VQNKLEGATWFNPNNFMKNGSISCKLLTGSNLKYLYDSLSSPKIAPTNGKRSKKNKQTALKVDKNETITLLVGLASLIKTKICKINELPQGQYLANL
jgi:hypothetical protein